ncbi:NfeD family protein [Echinimonas agarilytica]|uniref:NfeD family protein n=1 Tax=Echinimonas agarilytica TaxID=1215918 RepID=A0AA42B671_9GAMM|nr:NfeD family protein [Echinimonas agarilytica]MCM2678457.1 NfeD family protein [Echinimonas agarilytica]
MNVFTETLQNLTSTHWAVFGIVLVMIEIVVPSSWLLWPGLAALIIALVHWLIPMSWTVQLVSFSILTVAMVVIGRRFYNPANIESDQPDLNQQSGRHDGKISNLLEPSENGLSTIRLGDSDWRVEIQQSDKQDWPLGTKVEVIGQRSNTLLVEIKD